RQSRVDHGADTIVRRGEWKACGRYHGSRISGSSANMMRSASLGVTATGDLVHGLAKKAGFTAAAPRLRRAYLRVGRQAPGWPGRAETPSYAILRRPRGRP